MKKSNFLRLILIATLCYTANSNGIDYAPTMVAPNIISTGNFEGHASITPDENEMYYAVYNNDHSYSTIVVSKKKEEKWTAPEIVSFSGKYSDGSPALSPNGKRLYFSSKRPTQEDSSKRDNDIWYVERSTTDSGWGKPVWLKEVNTSNNEFSPSVDSFGNLYFCSNRKGGFGDLDIYYAENNATGLKPPLLLSDSINSKYQEGNVGVSPDGKTMFVMVQHKPGDFGYDDIHYSRKINNKWQPLKNIGSVINTYTYDFSPKVSPDGQVLYFSSRFNVNYIKKDKPYSYYEYSQKLKSPYNGLGNIYKISIDELDLE